MMDRNQVRARREGTFYHHLVQGRDDRGHDMATSQHCLANLHKIGHRMVAISDELW